VCALGLPENEPSRFILQGLKPVEILFINAIHEGVTVVKLGQNECTDYVMTCLGIQIFSDTVKVPELPIYGSGTNW
jgi:hypothetical protein